MNAILYTYQLLVFSQQCKPFEVHATCAEEACQTVKNILLSRRDYGMMEFKASDLLDHWLVMRTTPFEYCRQLHIESWDGQSFKSFGKAWVGEDLLSAVQRQDGQGPIPPAAQLFLASA